jgi:hypothetical protein
MIENKKGQCLGVAGGSTATGARIVGWTCLPSHHDQYWNYDCVYLLDAGQGCVLANLNTPVNAYSYGGKVAGVAEAASRTELQWSCGVTLWKQCRGIQTKPGTTPLKIFFNGCGP